MVTASADRTRRPSFAWLLIAVSCWLVAVGIAVAAVSYQRSATRPIGEGEVFAIDTASISEIVAETGDPDAAVRKARNSLDVEAVSIVADDGTIVASTSPTLIGEEVSNPLLGFGVQSRRFMALASPVGVTIEIDGIAEWSPSDVLYQVVSPLGDGSTLIHYDLAGLLARRSQPGDVQPGTLQLFGLAALFALIGGGVIVGRMRLSRRYREMALEAQLLKKHSTALESANRSLDKARADAEAALDLANEKIRIRSEFVLMINHELRTPLTSVVTGAELLRSGGLDEPEAAHVMEAMATDGRRLQEIIDQILAVARIENRGLAYELHEVTLDEVCAALSESHPALRPDHTPGRHPGGAIVRTDTSTLAIVVASLADNAITHGATNVELSCETERAIQPQVSVGREPESAVFISVGDDGPGIDPEFLPRVFEKFEKASFSSGTGLGLYMVRLMVEALDGSVGIHTSADGTIVEIAIPSVRALEPAGVL